MIDLTKLSDEELLSLHKKIEQSALLHNNQQGALKVLMNSQYGANGCPYYIFYDPKLASAITLSAQLSLKWVIKALEEHPLRSKYKWSVIYGDTDSVVGDTIIIVDGLSVKIADYFSSLGEYVSIDDERKQYVKVGKGKSPSVSSELMTEENNILYAMKHEVEKEFFEITVGEKSVVVTADHSIMVLRNGELIAAKPSEIIDGDELVLADYISKNFSVKSLGVKKDTVYDIEVENNHNFFANDILVHNSVYLSLEYVYNKIFEKLQDTPKSIDKLDSFCKGVIEPIIETAYEELAEYMNASENRMTMKREKITDTSLFVAKKRYALSVWDSEGVRYSEPKIKATGLEIVRSSIPEFARNELKTAIKYIMTDKSKLIEFIEETRKKFFSLSPLEVGISTSIKSYDNYIINNNGEITYKKGVPIGVRAAISHNNIVKKNDLPVEIINQGEKIKYVFMKMPNPCKENVLGFNVRFPDESLIEFIDYNRQFEKCFKKPIENITEKINMALNYNGEVNIEDIFS